MPKPALALPFLLLGCVACGGGSDDAVSFAPFATRAGGAGFDRVHAVASFADGSAVVTGSFDEDATFGAGEPSETILSAVNQEFYVARYDADGSLRWARQSVSTGGAATGNAIASLADGSAVVTGAIGGETTFGPGESNETTLSAAGDPGLFLARLDAHGALAWAKLAARAPRAEFSAIASFADGSIAITGWFVGDATFGPGEPSETILSSPRTMAFVARFEADGSLAWARHATGTGRTLGYGVAGFADGSLVITGSFLDKATFGSGEPGAATLLSAGLQDVYVAAYRADGSFAWARRAGGVGDEEAYAIAGFADGSFVITGMAEAGPTFGPGEANETTLPSTGGGDIFVARFGADGALDWARNAGGANDDWGLGVATFADGSVVVAGGFEGTATFGSGEAGEASLDANGDWDAFLARFRADGSLAWARSMGGPDFDEATAVAAFADGSSVAAGTFRDRTTIAAGEPTATTLVSAGWDDVVLVRVGADGGS